MDMCIELPGFERVCMCPCLTGLHVCRLPLLRCNNRGLPATIAGAVGIDVPGPSEPSGSRVLGPNLKCSSAYEFRRCTGRGQHVGLRCDRIIEKHETLAKGPGGLYPNTYWNLSAADFKELKCLGFLSGKHQRP
jgi:hypothetical protein